MARIYDYSPFSAQIPTGIVLAEGQVTIMNPYDTVAPEEIVVTQELLQTVRDAEVDTFYLIPGSIDAEVLESSASCIFNEIPDLSLTRQETVHNVRFGQLIVKTFFGDERVALSALKPHSSAQTLAHEFSLARYFMGEGREHGFRTFQPQGITRLASGEFALLSQYDHGVRSLDNIFWNPEHELESPLIIRALGKTAYLLGALHAAGWTHGDAQVKNMFVSNHQEVFIADLESMQPFKQKSGNLVEAAVAKSVDDDLRTLGKSFTARRDSSEQLSEEQLDLFNLIYSGIVNSPKSAIPFPIRKSSADIKDLLQQLSY